MTNKEIKTYVIRVPADLWRDFKGIIPKARTINEEILKLIKNYVQGDFKLPNDNDAKFTRQLAEVQQRLTELEIDMRIMKNEPDDVMFPSSDFDESLLSPVRTESGDIKFKKSKPLKYK